MCTCIRCSVRRASLSRRESIVADRNSTQKHVWRGRIVLLTAAGLGTTAIMREAGVAKTAVWRWQERFAGEGVEGLLPDKTPPSRAPPLADEVTERVDATPLVDQPGNATHRTGAPMTGTY